MKQHRRKRSSAKRSPKRSSTKRSGNEGTAEVFVIVSDELYEDLLEFADQKVMGFSLWEDSLTDALEAGGLQPGSAEQEDAEREKPTDTEMFDLDLYLEGGLYFELYGASFFPQIGF